MNSLVLIVQLSSRKKKTISNEGISVDFYFHEFTELMQIVK